MTRSLPPASGRAGGFPDRPGSIDVMRGIVVMLMTVDRASHAFSAGRYPMDAAAWYNPGFGNTGLPVHASLGDAPVCAGLCFPLSYCLLHVHLLAAGARLLGLQRTGGLTTTLAVSLAVMALLFPLCRADWRLKQCRAFGIMSYI
jgi:hypothetical protein